MANNDKTMDVSKPGKVAADASSRPIITHRPMVQDPMVKPQTDVSDMEPQNQSPKENKGTSNTGEKIIQPIDKELKADLSDIDKAAAAAAAPKQAIDPAPESKDGGASVHGAKAPITLNETVPNEPPKEVNEEAAKETPESDTKADKQVLNKEEAAQPKEEVEKPSSTSESAEVDAMVDQAAAGKHKDKQEAEQKAAKQERLQKLIEDKKYFVKTGQVARRRNNRIALALLVVIVLVIGLYLAVDAGVLKPGFDVPIHVINT